MASRFALLANSRGDNPVSRSVYRRLGHTFPILFLVLVIAPTMMYCSLALFASAAEASSPAITVRVNSVAGKVEIVTPDAKRRPLKTGETLMAGQAVETGPDGRAVLALSDGSSIQIFSDTHLEMNEILEEENPFSISLFLGRVSAKLRQLVSQDVVVTPTSVIGVRGTEFDVGVAEDGAALVSVKSGQIDIASDKDDQIETQVQLNPGQEVVTEEAGAPLVPRSAQIQTPEDWQNFRQQRLEKLIPRIPTMVQNIPKFIDKRQIFQENLKNRIKQKATDITSLWKQIKSLGPGQMPKKKELGQQMRENITQAFQLGRKFRAMGMQLKTAFVRLRTLQKILPRVKDKLGPEYEVLEREIAKTLGRAEEVRNRGMANFQEVKAAFTSIRGVMTEAQEAQARFKQGQPTGDKKPGR